MMRFFERQPGETTKSFEAWKFFRDLGPTRTLRKAAEIYYGSTANLRQIQEWSRKHDWVDRARAYEDYLEMVRRDAVAQYVAGEGESSVRRQQRIQEELLDVKERLVEKLLTMASWPLEKRTVEVDEDTGRQTVHIYPARWSFHTLIRGLEALDTTPDKVAFTDPTGAHQYGQSPDEIRAQFLELLEEASREVDEHHQREE